MPFYLGLEDPALHQQCVEVLEKIKFERQHENSQMNSHNGDIGQDLEIEVKDDAGLVEAPEKAHFASISTQT